jgi:hypothetical protein
MGNKILAAAENNKRAPSKLGKAEVTLGVSRILATPEVILGVSRILATLFWVFPIS